MNIRKKQLICILVVAFLCIFAKCVYAADDNGVTVRFNTSAVTTTADNNQVEFKLEIDYPASFPDMDGFSVVFDYNPDDIRVDSVTPVSATWGAMNNGLTNGSTINFTNMNPSDRTTKEVVLVKATVLNPNGTATFGFKDILYGWTDPETYDSMSGNYPSISINVTREQSIDIPDDPGYQSGNEDPIPSTITEEPVQEPTQEVTQIADNGSTGNVDVVDNTVTPTPEATKNTQDTTKATTKIPQTGANIVIYAIIGSALFGSVILYKKYSNK